MKLSIPIFFLVLGSLSGCSSSDPATDADADIEGDADVDADTDVDTDTIGDGDSPRDADGDEADTDMPQTPCGPLPVPYPLDGPLPPGADEYDIQRCGTDLGCLAELSNGAAYVGCFVHSVALCAWTQCREAYAALDCCLASACETSGLELTAQMSCAAEHCSAQYAAFARCGSWHECARVHRTTCFLERERVDTGDPFFDCVQENSFFTVGFEGATTTREEYTSCIEGTCNGDDACYIAQCETGATFSDCFATEQERCAYYTTSEELFDRIMCCIHEHCEDVHPTRREQCMIDHCDGPARAYALSFSFLCDDLATNHCIVD